MTIGTIIKKLRRERDITQEQLAEYLGISAQAVSLWETEKTAPDISQLPLLAHIFDVSTDEILGVRRAERELRLAEVKKEIKRLSEIGTESEVLALVRQAVAEFPLDESLKLNLAVSLQNSIWAENPDKALLDEAEKILINILENTRDIDMKCKAINALVTHYSYWYKDDARALEMAKRLPSMKDCREFATAWHVKNNAGSYLQQAIERCTEYLTVNIKELALDVELPNDESTWEQKIQMLKTANEITRMIFGEDMMYHHSESSYYAWYRADYQLALGNVDDALDSIEEMAEHAVAYDISYVSNRGRYFSSPFVNAINYSDANDEPNEHNLCWYALENLSSSRCDSIRNNERFRTVVKTLENKAK